MNLKQKHMDNTSGIRLVRWQCRVPSRRTMRLAQGLYHGEGPVLAPSVA
ncbi:hypothetical protein PI124_g20713 [Phytophthora idaei]|nr:hypothetical protein PI125_g22003 [Phytophthora idaei]KAG3131088.1 hypothetical protein PI126_g20216 [Phytophthora idaei]KAG3234233.1 hypothetical protein PI124_g20713 [Phytophthora idaei]